MATKRKYFGHARALKAYIGSKSVDLRLDRSEALLLAEKILRAANTCETLDLTAHLKVLKGGWAHLTVTSSK